MPYKNKEDLYAAQKRYRRRKRLENELLQQKLQLYEKMFGKLDVMEV